MTQVDPVLPAHAGGRGSATTRRGGPVGRFARNPIAVVATLLLLLIAGAAAAAPLLAPFDPTTPDLLSVLALPSDEHPLGADGVGRDVLSRLVFGAQTSLVAGLVAALVGVLVGVPMGLAAGYYGGRLDAVLSWVSNAIVALPGIIVILVVIAVLGPNMILAMAVFGVLIAPGFFRLTRAATLRVASELYVDAARVMGLSDLRIMGRHVATVIRAPIIIQASMMIGVGIAFQSGLTFLGLGSPRDASWGAMLNDAFANIYAAPGLIYPPGLAIGITVGAFALLGSAVRDALEDDDGIAAEPAAVPVEETRADASTDREPILAIRDLEVSYPAGTGRKSVVDGVTLSLAAGEVLGLVGESGSGKSQTAFALLGLLPSAARSSWSSFTVEGSDLTAPAARQLASLRGKRIAYIPQEPMSNLDPSFRIGQQMVEPLRLHLGLGAKPARERAVGLLDRVGIRDAARVFDMYPHQVSGGMAQRVLIAIAVSCSPDILIADEPTTALDVTVQAEILDLLRGLQREENLGILLVTHDFGVVADMCDRVAVMQAGRLIETGTAAELFSAPRHPYTRMLLDSTLEGKTPFAPLQRTERNGHA